MRSCQYAVLLGVAFLVLSCTKGKFRRGAETKGNSVSQENPQDQSQNDPNQPRDHQGNPTDEEGNPLPRPGKGVDPQTNRVPTDPNYDPKQDPHSPYNPNSPNFNPDLPPFDPNQPYGPGTNPGGPGVSIFPPNAPGNPVGTNPNSPFVPEPGQPGSPGGPGQVPLFPGQPGYWNPYGPDGPYRPILTDQVFNISCQNGVHVAEAFSSSENERISAVVRGELCPRSFNDTLVLFVVDYSASMGPHFDEDIGADSPGHDPLQGNSCGRLNAVQQVFNRIVGESPSQVDFAMIPFASEAIDSRVIRPTDLMRAQRYMDAEHFCRYVPQSQRFDGPGAIRVPGIGPSTNYASAFRRAHAALRASGKENLVMYFISDGEPTSPGNRNQALNEGARAGLELRNDPNVRSLVINGLYLGIPGSTTYQNAAGVLSQVTGSPNRVLPAEQASQLAEVINQFPQPTINLNAAAYRKMAWLEVRPYKRQALGIQNLYEKGPNLWEYETQPFLLLGIPGREVENVVNITIVGRNGFLYKTNVRIMYRML